MFGSFDLRNNNNSNNNNNNNNNTQFNNNSSNNSSDGPENFRNLKTVESDQSYMSYAKDWITNVGNNNQQINNNGEINEYIKNDSYFERLKRNPYIRNRYLNIHNQMDNSENQEYFIKFNTKPSENYKLRFYNYCSNNIKQEYQIRFYPKFYRLNYSQNNLQVYLKHASTENDKDLDQKNLSVGQIQKLKFNHNNQQQLQQQQDSVNNQNIGEKTQIEQQQLSNLEERKQQIKDQYAPFRSSWDSVTEKQVINTKEYKGYYSIQYDYQIFKMLQDQEISFQA